jgi:uncharacterized repeat protein (TIGR01451 family)
MFGLVDVFAGSSGLVIVSPILLLAGYGLTRLAATYRAEALVCALVAAGFVYVNVSYFQPYGGETFGPRFLAPALPFVALGLGPAFAARPRLSALAAAASIIPMTGLTLVWASHITLRQTIWGELARAPVQLGRSRLIENLTPTVFSELGPSRAWGALVVVAAAVAASSIGIRTMPRGLMHRRPRLRRRPLRFLLVSALAVYGVGAIDVCAIFAYPYGNREYAVGLPDLGASISASANSATPGGEVNFVVTLANTGRTRLNALLLTITLPAGLHLLGPPAVEFGAGCSDSTPIVCPFDALGADTTTAVRFGVTLVQPGAQTLTASATSNWIPAAREGKATIQSSS